MAEPSAQAGVAYLVRCAQRKQALALGGEVFLVALAAWLAVLAACQQGGVGFGRYEPWLLAAFGAGLAGCTLFWERRCSAVQVARRIDRNLRLGGALVTAFEHRTGPLAALLDQRVRSQVRAADARRAIPVRTLPFLALPLVAAIALASSVERARRPSLGGLDLEALVGLERDLQAAVEAAYEAREEGRMSGPSLEQLLDEKADLRVGLQSLRQAAGAGASRPQAEREVRDELRDIEEQLRRLTDDMRHCPDVARQLERAALRVDGARLQVAERELAEGRGGGGAGESPERGLPDERVASEAEGASMSSVEPDREANFEGEATGPPSQEVASAGSVQESPTPSSGSTASEETTDEPRVEADPGDASKALQDSDRSPGSSPDPQTDGGGGGVQDGQLGGPGESKLAPGAGDGTMSDSTNPVGLDRNPSVPARAPVQIRGPFWSPDQAPLLQRWIDARRRRLEERRP